MAVLQFICRLVRSRAPSLKSIRGLIASLCLAAILALVLAAQFQHRIKASIPLIGAVQPHPPLPYSDTENMSVAAELKHTPSTIVSVLIHGRSVRSDGSESASHLAAILLDPSQSLKSIRQAAWSLGKIGSPEAIATLRQVLLTAPAQLKSTIAEALGHSQHPQARDLLHTLLQDKDESVVRGAIRGLAAIADGEAITLLSEIIGDRQRSRAVRTEAAIALGEVGTPDAYRPLIKLGGDEQGREIAEAVLSGLGRQPFDRTSDFFRAYLESAHVDPEMRVLALESLGDTTGDAAPFLATFLTSKDADVRAAAAWALANLEEPGDVAQQLVWRLRTETQPEVRARLYQALENQETSDPASLLPLVVSDADTTARVTGMKFLATQLAFGEGNHTLAKQFDEAVVPQLADLAIKGKDFQTRLGSIIVLRQARTPQSLRALETIAARSGEAQIVRAATLK